MKGLITKNLKTPWNWYAMIFVQWREKYVSLKTTSSACSFITLKKREGKNLQFFVHNFYKMSSIINGESKIYMFTGNKYHLRSHHYHCNRCRHHHHVHVPLISIVTTYVTVVSGDLVDICDTGSGYYINGGGIYIKLSIRT